MKAIFLLALLGLTLADPLKSVPVVKDEKKDNNSNKASNDVATHS